MSDQPLILVVQHEDGCPPQLLGGWLTQSGAVLDVRRPGAGEELPADLADHDAFVVLGGHMGAYDDDEAPWLPQVRALIRTAADAAVPTLGICLGHQLIAVALGGRVTPNPSGQQSGVLPVGWRPEAATDPLLGTLLTRSTPAQRGIQWNNDIVVELPDGARVLAETEAGELQAARFASTVWGLQVHPEADLGLVRGWVAQDPGPNDDVGLSQVVRYGDEVAAGWAGLGPSFVGLVRALAA